MRVTAGETAAGDAAAPTTPDEQRAWIGRLLTAAILVYCVLHGGEMVADDGTMIHSTWAIAGHIGALVLVWVVVSVWRKRGLDAVEQD